MDNWLNRGVVGGASWPKEDTHIQFGGHEFILKPATRDTEQTMCINLTKERMTEIEAMTLMNRFLSVLSWCNDQGMELLDCVGSSNVIPASVPRKIRIIGSSFVFPFYRKLPNDPKVRLALALYREGLTVNSIPFSFLSFFKVINIFWNDKWVRNKNELIEGIRALLPQIKDEFALKRLTELAKTEKDIPEYLYESERCAIAHAYSDPVIDPDDETHLRRLAWDILIIQEIATYLIEDKLGVSRLMIDE